MVTWVDNPIMFWYDANAAAYVKVTDHNRGPLQISVERIETKTRMADGTLRRYSVAKKHTWVAEWTTLPSTNYGPANSLKTVDGGMAGSDIELFYNTYDTPFNMKLQGGDGSSSTYVVMISDFSKTISKRGLVDFWDLSITLEEV